MNVNRERDISRQCEKTTAQDFHKFLLELSSVGPSSAKKYVSVLQGLLGSTLLFSRDGSIKYIKRKNRVYVRAAVVKFLDYLEHAGQLTEEEIAIWKQKLPVIKEAPPKPREIPSVQDILKVIQKMDKEEKPIAEFMFYTGCRIHEALGTKLRDIDFKTGRAIIYGKGRLQKKPRPVKLPMEYIRQLQQRTAKEGILPAETIFWSDSGATIESKVDMFNRKLKKICDEVLGKSTGSHDFRRVVATNLLEKSGGNLQLVKRILGHEKIETTLKYTQYVDREKDLDAGLEIMSSTKNNNKK